MAGAITLSLSVGLFSESWQDRDQQVDRRWEYRMRRLVPLLMLTLATAGQANGNLVAAESLDDRVTATETEQIRELLSEGVKQYRIGRRQEAAVTFRRALEMDPSDRLLYHFYLSVGDELMHRMMEDGELKGSRQGNLGPKPTSIASNCVATIVTLTTGFPAW